MQTRISTPSIVMVATLLLASPVGAKEPTDHPPTSAVALGAKLGIVLPQIATELGTTWGAEIEGSFLLPALERRLAAFAAFGYTQPVVSRTALSDPRLAGAYDGKQTQRELTLGAGVLARLFPPGARFNGYSALGARLYFLETVTVGAQGGAAFGENQERSTRVGAVFTVGGEMTVWRGAAGAELQLGASDLPHTITGDVSTGALSVVVGYRLFL